MTWESAILAVCNLLDEYARCTCPKQKCPTLASTVARHRVKRMHLVSGRRGSGGPQAALLGSLLRLLVHVPCTCGCLPHLQGCGVMRRLFLEAQIEESLNYSRSKSVPQWIALGGGGCPGQN